MHAHKIAGLGWKRDSLDHRDHYFEVVEAAPIADMVDLSPEMPPVVSQGQLGSCTSFGTAGVLDFARHKQGLPFMGPSHLFIYYNERAIEGTVKTDSGAEVRDGLKVLAQLGAPPETDWPYDIAKFAKKPPAKAYRDAVKHEALSYARVPQTQQALSAALSSGFPVVYGFSVFDAFESPEVARTGVVPMPQPGEQPIGGHCVVMCGYNTPKQPGKVLVQNSWGTDWGDAGRFYMDWRYILNPRLASDFWVLRLVSG